MTREEAREAVQELLKENSPEDVAEGFYKMYVAGKLEFEDLQFLVDECGFELADEFVNATDEERKKMYVDEEDDFEEILEEDGGSEVKEESKVKEEVKEDEENRASKAEGYDGEKVYDKKGNPTQRAVESEEEETEQEKAEKLYNLKF